MGMRERAGALGARVGNLGPVVRLRTLYESLSPRDQRLVLMLAGFFTVLIVFGIGLSAQRYLRKLEQDIARKEEQLVRIATINAEYSSLQDQIAAFEGQLKQDPNFNLTSFLERTANETAFATAPIIQSKADVAKEGFKEVSADVKVRKASLEQLVKYLYAVESAPQHMSVRTLRIRTSFGSKSELDADLEIFVLAPQES